MGTPKKLPFGLQSPVGFRFGLTRVVDEEQVSFEIDLVVPKGIECQFRLDLPDGGEPVTGAILIERTRAKRADSLPRYLARFVDLSEGDRGRINAWRAIVMSKTGSSVPGSEKEDPRAQNQ